VKAYQKEGTVYRPFLFFIFMRLSGWTSEAVFRIFRRIPTATAHFNVNFAKVYTEQTVLTAADAPNDKVILFFDDQIRKLELVTTYI
jgi:hypothetical protein